MPSPILRRREDIWNNFPVIANPMGRGANGADRHCVQWHNKKVRQIGMEERKSDAQVKAEVLPRMLRALASSSAWTYEAPPPGSDCVAIIAMKFKPRNNTRRNANNGAKANATRRWNRTSPSQTKAKSPKAKSPVTRKSANKPHNKPNNAVTRKAPKNHGGLEGEAMYRKARAILNIMSAKTVEQLSHEFASLVPRTVGDAEELFKIIAEIALDQQAYHPLIIHLLHVLDSVHEKRPYPQKPSEAVSSRMLARALEEPLFAKMEAAAEEENASPNKNIEEKVNLQRRFFRSVMLFTGFLYREGLMSWTSYKSILRHFAAFALETDPAELDYRVFDGYVQGLVFTLIRGGARMVATGGEAGSMFASLAEGLKRLSVEAKRGAIRTQCAEFLKSAAEGFKIYEGLPWSVGAPLTDLKVRVVVGPAGPAAVAAAAPQEGLSADISELWRRFPLDVKQDGDKYVVRFHNKKLQERYQRESGKYKSVADLEAALGRHILKLIDTSAHWKQAAHGPGVLAVVVKK